MKAQIMREFEYACKEYLSTLDIGRLRNYGRSIGVDNPTKKNKGPLINMIIGILTGKTSSVLRNGRGAPVKNNYVDPSIAVEIEKRYQAIVARYNAELEAKTKESAELPNKSDYDIQAELETFRRQGKTVIRVEDGKNSGLNIRQMHEKPLYIGQLQTVQGISMLVPLDCKLDGDKIIFPVEKIRSNGLMEGDVLSCYAEKNRDALVVTDVLMINGLTANSFKRKYFDDMEVCYPHERIAFYNGAENSVTAKYLQWLLPIGKGQRASVIASPKAGKTTLLLEAIKNVSAISQNLTLLVLLIDSSPESVSRFRGVVGKENLLYTTYEDDSERQVFVADFALQRAKRLSESGKDVLLVVDSLNALAKAYNETGNSVGGKTLAYGLESKTLHYIKKYFGTARCLEKGGSLTMIGTISVDTGNPVDDVLACELSSVSNLEIRLSEKLALKRIYPAIDFARSALKDALLLLSEEEQDLERTLKTDYLPRYGIEELYNAVLSEKEYRDFYTKIKSKI